MLRLPARLERLQRRAAGVERRRRSSPHVPVGNRLALGQSRPHGTDLGRGAALQLLVAPQSKKQPSRCAAYDLYGGIRQCYTFIDMVDGVPNASDGEKARWKAEAKFLIAYFHYSLLRLYGPICLVNGIIPNDAPEEVYYPTRRPYDECVSWIARKFDEAPAN